MEFTSENGAYLNKDIVTRQILEIFPKNNRVSIQGISELSKSDYDDWVKVENNKEKESTMDMKYFNYDHLPPHLQPVSKLIGDVANEMNEKLESHPEKSAGMRKLLEAKDCFVRASLPE